MKTQFTKIARRLPASRCSAVVLTWMIGIFCLSDEQAFSRSLSNPDTTDTAFWRIVIPSKAEPGEPLIVSGIVYAPDGKTPVEGITVYVYHTDAEGYYRKGNNSSSNPRLHGTMRTNAAGKYEYRTIKPAAYPGGGNPAHVHYVISGKGYAKQYAELQFEGDRWLRSPNLSAAQRADTFSQVRPLTREKDGVWRVVKDIRLE
jgi:protocatechuate 3,4-dioxygenase beta subunit